MAQFRAKARAVDLLGKGQIADLPTAITELWKNGYDAYADNVTAELYLPEYKDTQESIFLITDDGKGMSRKDIFEKWLVLGVDAKSRGDFEEKESEETLWKKPRIKAGEKGIGRLSVAFLGSPMLMLTKKRGNPIQALYFDWRLLENFNLFLDDVQIPVTDIEKSADFTRAIKFLTAEFLKNFELTKDNENKPIWEKRQKDLRDAIVKSTEKLRVPSYFEHEILKGLLNVKDDNGTKFIIFEPEPQVGELITGDRESIGKDFLRTSIAGFTNQFKKNPLPLKVSVPIHKNLGNDYDFLTSAGDFFTPSDFDLADILVEGRFDGEGKFIGTVKIYEQKPFEHTYISPRKKDNRSNYGPFKLKLGYSLGLESESKLEKDVFNKLKRRIRDYGGLYIYRDGFRVLPYGRTEYDFLEFERKRALKAGEAFWSHRRMFGYIEISRTENESLKDKAGREGLINNASFRAFKNDLEGVFDDLATEYFSDKAKKSLFIDLKKQLKEQHEEIKKDKEREKQEKISFSKSLKEYPNKFKDYRNRYQSAIAALGKKIAEPEIIYSEIENILDDINKFDLEFEELLPKIPKRYKPTETQLDRLSEYEELLLGFNVEIKSESEKLMEVVHEKLAAQELRKEFNKNLNLYKAELENLLYKSKEQLNKKFSKIINEYDQRGRAIVQELDIEKDKLLAEIETKKDVAAGIKKVKAKFDFLREQINKQLIPTVEHIQRLDFEIDEELVQGAYKAEYENIKYQWEQTRETAQLGIAVEIIDHEFNALYSQINHSIKKLDAVIPDNAVIPYGHLKKSFDQLEDKYELLSPLYRISGAIPKKISGRSINSYLHKFFTNKLEVEDIKLTATDSFNNVIIEIKEPVIHTVFINIVNNAIYWLRNAEKKQIKLDYLPKTGEILIMNSGAKIEDRRLGKIFELFYSNRPNGRGIGLYLAKESLQENYFDIYATNDPNYNELGGACFVIKSQKN